MQMVLSRKPAARIGRRRNPLPDAMLGSGASGPSRLVLSQDLAGSNPASLAKLFR